MQTLFYNGEILTMCGRCAAEAVLVEGGRVLAVGEMRAVAAMAGRRVEVVDLGGRTLMPGFVDCGGDFLSVVRRFAVGGAGIHRAHSLRAAVSAAVEAYLSRGIVVLHGRGLDVAGARAIVHSDIALPLYFDVDIADYEGVKRVAAVSRGRLQISGLSLDLDVREDGGQAVGVPAYCDRAVAFALRMAAAEGIQAVVRAESEATVRQFLRVARAIGRVCPTLCSSRPVLLDARYLPPTEMEQVRRLGVIPCFAADILPRMGDDLLSAVGFSAASRLTPYAAARAAGVPYTLCAVLDGVGVVPDAWWMVCAAVGRRTARGVLLGGTERAGVMDALRAVTWQGAWRYHAEGRFGSIRAGMSANFTVMDGGVLSVATEALPELSVAQVWVDGERVWERGPTPVEALISTAVR